MHILLWGLLFVLPKCRCLWVNIKGCILIPLEWIRNSQRTWIFFRCLILSFRYDANRCYELFCISLSIKADNLHGHHKLVYITVHNLCAWCTSGCKIDYCIMHPVYTEVTKMVSYLNDVCVCHILYELLKLYGEGFISLIALCLPYYTETRTAHNLVVSTWTPKKHMPDYIL